MIKKQITHSQETFGHITIGEPQTIKNVSKSQTLRELLDTL